MIKRLYYDADGILFDFVGHMVKNFGYTYSYNDDFFVNTETLEKVRMKKGEWDIFSVLGIKSNEIYKRCTDKFWTDLPLTPEADALINIARYLIMTHKVEFYIYTSPTHTGVQGKYDACRKILSRITKGTSCPNSGLILGTDKFLAANPESLLIDDRDKNIDKWIVNKGVGILYPRIWNREHFVRNNGLEIVAMDMAPHFDRCDLLPIAHGERNGKDV